MYVCTYNWLLCGTWFYKRELEEGVGGNTMPMETVITWSYREPILCITHRHCARVAAAMLASIECLASRFVHKVLSIKELFDPKKRKRGIGRERTEAIYTIGPPLREVTCEETFPSPTLPFRPYCQSDHEATSHLSWRSRGMLFSRARARAFISPYDLDSEDARSATFSSRTSSRERERRVWFPDFGRNVNCWPSATVSGYTSYNALGNENFLAWARSILKLTSLKDDLKKLWKPDTFDGLIVWLTYASDKIYHVTLWVCSLNAR